MPTVSTAFSTVAATAETVFDHHDLSSSPSSTACCSARRAFSASMAACSASSLASSSASMAARSPRVSPVLLSLDQSSI
ncbi:hypothetical protein MM221_15250 [Salipaludibacillus sp. LMS25]|uniref:hypothetical protein n=1 Tax=Salipaludibacillus sp. LMS25 TaxID=2924031 RepID=UPI0020D09CE5|nr:hypothetical protein [Salipaludibacillus sp. LMS25]UTR13954.1 hypothetical protein MM221_15250 [Salipaludibacillus sp. LMS25]